MGQLQRFIPQEVNFFISEETGIKIIDIQVVAGYVQDSEGFAKVLLEMWA